MAPSEITVYGTVAEVKVASTSTRCLKKRTSGIGIPGRLLSGQLISRCVSTPKVEILRISIVFSDTFTAFFFSRNCGHYLAVIIEIPYIPDCATEFPHITACVHKLLKMDFYSIMFILFYFYFL